MGRELQGYSSPLPHNPVFPPNWLKKARTGVVEKKSSLTPHSFLLLLWEIEISLSTFAKILKS